ncbi:hypothetical protein B5S33_g822 [[Candida] boidinii]|nr:hypothetical protein B5S33_g822 [[Candida] boidinii]
MLDLFEIAFSYQEPPDGIFSPKFPMIAGQGSTGERFTGNPKSLIMKLKYLRKVDRVKKISLKFIGEVIIDHRISSKSTKDDVYGKGDIPKASKNGRDQQYIRFFNYEQVLVDFGDVDNISSVNKYVKEKYEKNEEVSLIFEEFRFPYETFILPSSYEYKSFTSSWSLKIRYYLECELVRDTSLNSVTKVRKMLMYQSGHFHNFTNRSNYLELNFLLDASDSHVFKKIPKKLIVNNHGELVENPLSNSRGHSKAIMSLVNPLYKKEKNENSSMDIRLDLKIIPNTFSDTHRNYFDIGSDILNDLGVLEIKTDSVPPEGLIPHFKYLGQSTGLGEFHITSIKIYLKDTITLRRKQEIICVLDTKKKKLMEKISKSEKDSNRSSQTSEVNEKISSNYNSSYNYESDDNSEINQQRSNYPISENEYLDDSHMKFDVVDFERDPNSGDFHTYRDFKDLLGGKEYLFPKPQFGSFSIPKFFENDVSLEVSIKIESQYRNKVISKNFNFEFGIVLANNKNIHPLDSATEPQRHCYSGFPLINYLNESDYKEEFLKFPQIFEDRDTADSSFREFNSYSSASSSTNHQYQKNDSPLINSEENRNRRTSYLSVPPDEKYRSYSGSNNSYRTENRNYSGYRNDSGDRNNSKDTILSGDRIYSKDSNSSSYFENPGERSNTKGKFPIIQQESGWTDRNEDFSLKVPENTYSDTNTGFSNDDDQLDDFDDEIPDNSSYFAFPKNKTVDRHDTSLHYSASVASSVYPTIDQAPGNQYSSSYPVDRSSRPQNYTSRGQNSYKESITVPSPRGNSPRGNSPRGLSPRGLSPRGLSPRGPPSRGYDSKGHNSRKYDPHGYDSDEYHSNEHRRYDSKGYNTKSHHARRVSNEYDRDPYDLKGFESKRYNSEEYNPRSYDSRKPEIGIENNNYSEARSSKNMYSKNRNPYETNRKRYSKQESCLETAPYETGNTSLNSETYKNNKSDQRNFHENFSIPTASPDEFRERNSSIPEEKRFGPSSQSYKMKFRSQSDHEEALFSQKGIPNVPTKWGTNYLRKPVVNMDHNKEAINSGNSMNQTINKDYKSDSTFDRVPFNENSNKSSAIGVLRKKMVTSKDQSSANSFANYNGSSISDISSARSFPHNAVRDRQSERKYEDYFDKYDSDSDIDDSLKLPNSIFFKKKE